MNNNNLIRYRRFGVILAFGIIALIATEPVYCEEVTRALLLHRTPVQGGYVTPDVGIHHFQPNTDITLTAIPRANYQFLYWLGDVSDPTSNTTTLRLDSPKIVVAVFERAEYDFLAMLENSTRRPGGGAYPSRTSYGGGGGSAFYGGSSPPVEYTSNITNIVIPEPGTVVLLSLGGLLTLAAKRRRKISSG